MATDYALDFSPAPSLTRLWLPVAGFLALMGLIFVGLDAFSPPAAVASFGGVAEAAGGDTLRQIAYLGAAFLIFLAAIQRHGWAALGAVPASMMLLLAWCLASAFWAAEPGIVLRRAGLEVIIVGSLFLSVDALGAERAFRIWRWVLAAVLLVNFLSIPVIASARHLAGEADPGLIGDWRGLYGHKNIAGAVCAMTAILFLFSKNGWRNWGGIAIALAACVFLYFTRSKSSAGFLPLAVLAGILYRAGWRDGLSRAILTVILALLTIALAAFVLIDAAAIIHVLEDPTEFTGRAAIWAAEIAYIRDHPLLGAGFGTFTATGGLSPLHDYVSGSWVEAVSHGHNGYLQLMVTIGGVGFFLAMLALVLVPIRRFWTLDMEGDGFRPMLFALFTFFLMHNFMESDFLEGDGVTWAGLLLVVAALHRPGQRYSLRRG
jgi:O-antigen ligase